MKADELAFALYKDCKLEVDYQEALARRSSSLSIWVNHVMAIAWLSCFPKLLISYNISLRHMLIMSVWVLMAVGQWAYASALRKETRLLFHERIKARCVIVNALGAMVVIILLKAGEIGQGAPVPASLVQAGFILVYQTRFNTSLQLHLLSFFSSLIMELGRWLEGASLQRCAWESMLLATLGVVAPLALSLYWEANFRRHLVQRQLAGKLAGDRPCAKQRVGPFWSFLLGV